jgi:adenylylsulfate kinase-like enzyme
VIAADKFPLDAAALIAQAQQPYEAPEAPELRIDTTESDAGQAAEAVLERLRRMGFIT